MLGPNVPLVTNPISSLSLEKKICEVKMSEKKFSKVGTKIFLEVRGKKHEAGISELPFYKKKYVR